MQSTLTILIIGLCGLLLVRRGLRLLQSRTTCGSCSGCAANSKTPTSNVGESRPMVPPLPDFVELGFTKSDVGVGNSNR